jgi:hypothetical protein
VVPYQPMRTEPASALLVSDGAEHQIAPRPLLPCEIRFEGNSHRRHDIEHVDSASSVDEAVLDLCREGIDRPGGLVGRYHIEMWHECQGRLVGSVPWIQYTRD